MSNIKDYYAKAVRYKINPRNDRKLKCLYDQSLFRTNPGTDHHLRSQEKAVIFGGEAQDQHCGRLKDLQRGVEAVTIRLPSQHYSC